MQIIMSIVSIQSLRDTDIDLNIKVHRPAMHYELKNLSIRTNF